MIAEGKGSGHSVKFELYNTFCHQYFDSKFRILTFSYFWPLEI